MTAAHGRRHDLTGDGTGLCSSLQDTHGFQYWTLKDSLSNYNNEAANERGY